MMLAYKNKYATGVWVNDKQESEEPLLEATGMSGLVTSGKVIGIWMVVDESRCKSCVISTSWKSSSE